MLIRYRAINISKAEGQHVSRVRALLGGVHEANRDYISERLCNNVNGLIWCHFMDNDTQAEIIFDNRQLDQFTLLTAIQRLGHSIELLKSETVQTQLRIEGMHCTSCVSNISGTVLDLSGVIDIHLTLLDKLATVIYNSCAIQLDTIVAEIEKLGFQVAVSIALPSSPSTTTMNYRSTKDEDTGAYINIYYSLTRAHMHLEELS